MQRNLLGLLITVLLLTIVFSGCSEKNNNSTTGEPNNNTSTAEPEEQFGSLEVTVIDENDNVVSNTVVWLWTQENFGVTPNWTDDTKTTVRGNSNSTGKILFSNLDAGEYVVSLSILFFPTEEEALAHVKHVTINANEVTNETLQIPTKTNNNNPTNPSGPTEEDALSALSNGTKILDKTNDFVITGNKEDNPSPYPIGFADLKEVDIGVDITYIYIRYWFNGTWPVNNSDWPNINGDQITDINCATFFDTDSNPSTGVQSDYGTESQVLIGSRRNNSFGLDPPYIYGLMEGPTGIEFPETQRYRNQYNDYGFRFGGGGYDYIICAYPLSKLNLRAGQNITILSKVETNSIFYGHSTFDPLRRDYKNTMEPDRYEITLGENRTIS